MKIEVQDNKIEQALRVGKRKLTRDGCSKVIKLTTTNEKQSEIQSDIRLKEAPYAAFFLLLFLKQFSIRAKYILNLLCLYTFNL